MAKNLNNDYNNIKKNPFYEKGKMLCEMGFKRRRILYSGTVCFIVLSVLQSKKGVFPEIIGMAVYILAGVALVVSGGCLYQEFRRGLMEKILNELKKNSLCKRYLEDYGFRTILTTLLVLLINTAYTVYNGIIGIMNHSVWFITMAVYYSLLGLMRFRALRTGREIARIKDQNLIREKECSILKTNGALLLLLNMALGGVVFLTISEDTASRYPEVIIISIATYTFYKTTVAVINMFKVSRMQSPILSVVRNIGTADALVSMLTLQTAMLASFQETGTIQANQMNAVTGLAVCIMISAMGIRMIYLAHRIRKES